MGGNFGHFLPLFPPQNSQQKSVLDLYVVTVAFLALKNCFFHFFRPKKKFQKIFYKIIMQLFNADTIVFSKKFQKKFYLRKTSFFRAKNATVTT